MDVSSCTFFLATTGHVFFFEGNSFFEAVVGLWENVIIRNDSVNAADRAVRN